MRVLLLGDLIAAARALLCVPRSQRKPLIRLMLQQAEAAHEYQNKCSLPHPAWGNGSLMACANTMPQVVEPYASEMQYLQSLHLVIAEVIAWQRDAIRRRSPVA